MGYICAPIRPSIYMYTGDVHDRLHAEVWKKRKGIVGSAVMYLSFIQLLISSCTSELQAANMTVCIVF